MINLVQGQIEAYNLFDLDSFCSFYHPEVIVKNFSDHSILLEGLERFEDYYKKLFQKYPNQKCELCSRIMVGEYVLDEEMIFGRPEFTEGKKVVAVYGFRDGLIDRVWFIR
jgi:hypothetical protein